jgi:hypothetical protein
VGRRQAAGGDEVTKDQTKAIRAAQHRLGIDDGEYRMILRNIGGVRGDAPSTLKLTNDGFENVMAHFEERGFGTRDGHASFYWRDIVDNRGILAKRSTVYVIRQLAPQQRYQLPTLCLHFSNGRTSEPSKLNPAEAYQLIEMLKSVIAREELEAANATD